MTVKYSWDIRKEAIGVANELTLKTEEQHRVVPDPKGKGNKGWLVYNAVRKVYVDSEGNAYVKKA